MKTANIKDFWTYCKEYIKYFIKDYVDHSVYACDFGFDLTRDINQEGFLYDLMREEEDVALQWLHKWWQEASKFDEYVAWNYGESYNPFKDPNGYLVRMVVAGVESLISNTDWANESGSEKVKITAGVANRICKEIDAAPLEF